MASESNRYDVFISYPHAQKTMADAVCATLEQNKIRCWIAPRDVLPGEPFAKAIIRAMNESRLFVLVFSAETNESNHVKNEVERAVSKGLSIIVFRVEDVVPTEEMEYYLSRRHWLDAMTPPIEAHFQKLIQAIRALLAIPSLEAAPDQSEQKVADLRVRAREAAAQADWDLAVALLGQAATVSPDDPKTAEMLQAVRRDQHLADLRRQAQERLAIRDWTGAIAILEEASSLQPDDADLTAILRRAQSSQRLIELRGQAEEFLTVRDWAGAIAILEKAIQLAPDDPELTGSLRRAQRGQSQDDLKAQALHLAAQHDWQGVLVLLKQAPELAAEDAEVQRLAAQAAREQRIADLQVRAKSAYSARQWAQALPLLEELRALTPDDAAARDMLATTTREGARQRQLDALIAHAEDTVTRARSAATTGQWEAAERGWQDAAYAWGTVVTALEEHLAMAPQDATRRERLTEAQRGQKEAAQQAGRLRDLAQRYADAQAALDAARPDQAVPLLSAIIAEAPGYRDTVELLRRAQRKVKGGPFPRRRMLWIGAAALVLIVVTAAILLSGVLQRGAASERATTLQQALTNQWVDAQIRGTGAAYGDCITARLTRRIPDILPLDLAQGTLLLSKTSTVQDMVVLRVRAIINQDGGLTPTDAIRIADDNPQEYLIEAYGLNSSLAAPGVGAAFVVAGPADEAVQSTLRAAAQLTPDGAAQAGAALQLALWLHADHENRAAICQRINCKAEDLALAEQILGLAGFGPPPTPTATATALPTATLTAEPTIATPFLRRAATDTPTPTATATSTPLPSATMTATATPARSATPTPRPSATATRTPAAPLRIVTPTRPPAPPASGLAPQTPADGQIFIGRSTVIRLAWTPATRPLAGDEYYLVTILFPHEQATWTDSQWTRTPEVTVPAYLYDNVTGDRSFRWQVSLVRLNAGDPSGDPQGKTTLIVAPGAWRTFRWLPEAEGGGGGGGGEVIPTNTPRPEEPTITPRP